jgi:hypothetical protein
LLERRYQIQPQLRKELVGFVLKKDSDRREAELKKCSAVGEARQDQLDDVNIKDIINYPDFFVVTNCLWTALPEEVSYLWLYAVPRLVE